MCTPPKNEITCGTKSPLDKSALHHRGYPVMPFVISKSRQCCLTDLNTCSCSMIKITNTKTWSWIGVTSLEWNLRDQSRALNYSNMLESNHYLEASQIKYVQQHSWTSVGSWKAYLRTQQHINRLDIMDINKLIHPTTDDTFFTSSHETFTNIDHILCQKYALPSLK